MGLTKEQIKSKINDLTYEKNNYESKKKQYREALNSANKLVSNINDGKKSLELTKDSLKKYFTINDKIVGEVKINRLCDDTLSMQKKISNSVIPSIKSEIKNIENNIISLNSEILYLKNELYYTEK